VKHQLRWLSSLSYLQDKGKDQYKEKRYRRRMNMELT
jgi:hypothetical protein